MRLVMAVVLAGSVALPVSVSAQDGEEGAGAKSTRPGLAFIPEHLKQRLPQHRHKPVPSAEPALEEPALQLQLDDAGVEVAPSPPQTFGGYTLEELEVRKRRASLALIAPAVTTVAGIALLVFGTSGDCYDYAVDDWDYRDACRRPRIAGGVLTGVGGVGMITGSALAARRSKEFSAAKEYTRDEIELRVKRTRIGLYTSSGIFVAGVTMGFVALANYESCFLAWECPEYPDWVGPVGWTGFTLAVGGLTGMVTSGVLLGKSRRERDRLSQVARTPRRVQWDLAQSRLVF